MKATYYCPRCKYTMEQDTLEEGLRCLICANVLISSRPIPTDPEQECLITCAYCGTPIDFRHGEVFLNGPSYACINHLLGKI